MLQADLIIMGLRLPVGGGGQAGYHVGALATGATTDGAGGDDATTTVGAEAETADLDRWFLSSTRPPDPCSPEWLEAMTAPQPEPGWRRRVGWFFVAACLISGLCIVATAAARARTRTTARAIDQDSQTVAAAPQKLASGVVPPVASLAGAPVGRATDKVEAKSSAPASHTASAPVSLSPRTENHPSSRVGNVRLPPSAQGHRLFVDGKAAGETTALVRLQCGHHTLRIGSQGRERSVEVPCGATIALAP